tara:strand:- start:54954 stop:55541 length:588 start_codon:yes stop_codon:yes gene_type:complete
MSTIFLIEQLNTIANAKKENRQRVAKIVLENEHLLKELVTTIFKVDDTISIKAAWVLEWICTHHHINWILPHLQEFTTKISTLTFDSAIRPCAKICEHLAKAYYAKHKNEVQEKLKSNHMDIMIETGFDWLITPQKIAVKAYTMNTLYALGLERDWIHPELKHLIETKIIHESKGTKARGKHILQLIEKHQKSRS